MSTPVVLLESIGQALLSSGALSAESFDRSRVVRDLWSGWARDLEPSQRQADLQALRSASPAEVQIAISNIIRLHFADTVPSAVVRYLAAVAFLAHRLPDRPLQNSMDLIAWLPARLPLFEGGDQPVGIGDRELLSAFSITESAECWLARNHRLPLRPPVLLAFYPDQNDAIIRLLDWHARAGIVSGLLGVEHSFLRAEIPCLQFRWEANFASMQGSPSLSLLQDVIAFVAQLHAMTPPLCVGEFGLQEIIVSQGDGPKFAGLLLLDPPAHNDPCLDVYHLGLLMPEDLPQLQSIRSACLANDPMQRPPDARELLKQVQSLLSPTPQASSKTVETLFPAEPRDPTTGKEEVSRLRTRGKRGRDIWEKLGTLQAGPEMPKMITNSVGMRFALIPEGNFMMGSPPTEPGRRDNEGPVHEVVITRAFYLGVHPVTQQQYLNVIGSNPARFQGAAGGGPEHPVECVNWDDAVAFCVALGGMEAERQAGRSYRLPTEAEWEYACRSGTTTPFALGTTLGVTQAGFDGNHPYGEAARGPSVQRTVRVGSFPDNRFGLYDMHGNVWEWCSDWYDANYYRQSPRQDPPGPEQGVYRVLRGGSWRNQAVTCRSAYRNALAANQRQPFLGFRVVLMWTPPVEGG